MSSNAVVIHVRFAPDGSVTEIGERPSSFSAQQWYDKLCHAFATSFMALSGGRGVFRLSAEEVSALKTTALQ
jgi:hypothetical protein